MKRRLPAQLPSAPGLVAWGSMISTLLPVAMGAAILGPQGLAWLPAVLAVALALRPGYGGAAGLAQEIDHLDRPLMVALALFVAWALAVSAPSPQAAIGLLAVAQAGLTLAAVVVAAVLAGRLADIRPWRWGYFAAVHIVFALVIVLLVSRVIDLSPLGGRRLELLWHYNRAAVMAALTTPLALFAIAHLPWPIWQRRSLAILAAGVGVAAVFASESASAQLALLVAGATGLLWLAAGPRAIWISLSGFAALTLALPVVMTPLHALARDSALWAFQPNTIAARLNIWAGTAAQIMERPWFGHGAEHARLAGFVDPVSGARVFHNHPHSLPMQVWLDLGLVGVVLLLAVLACGYRLIARQRPGAAVMLLCIVNAALAVLCVSHGMWQGWYLGLVGIVLAFALMLVARTRLP